MTTSISGPDARFNPSENFAFSIAGDLGVRATYHTNPTDFNGVDDVANGGTTDWKEPLPLISVPFETWIGDNIYGYSSFDVLVNRTLMAQENEDTEDLDTDTLGLGFVTNILMFPPSSLADMSLNFPLRAFGAIGSDYYTIQIGRDNVSWGAGESGNLVLGDQLPYHNQFRFTAFSEKFKYTFLISAFNHPSNYIESEEVEYEEYDKTNPSKRPPESGKIMKDWINNYLCQYTDRDGVKAFVGHRLEWTIGEKIGMALTETIMYQNDKAFDLTVLSPTMIYHNLYMRANANSMLSFEIDYSPIKNVNIYGQLAIDEFRLPGEFELFGPPSAKGIIIGAKAALPLESGILYGSVEYAYTDPYLYLRDDGESYDPYNYGINYIVDVPEFVVGNLSNYTLKPIGYKYGNDVMVANLNVGYKVFGKWYVEGTFRYLLDGCFDIYTRWNNDVIPGTDNCPSAPSTTHPDEGSYDPYSNWEERNAVAKNIALTLKGGITLTENFDIEAEATFITINNFQNIAGVKTSDTQFQISAKYSF